MATKKFSKEKTITQKNLENVPDNKPGVYRIKNADHDILCIGKARGGRLPDRIAEHKGEFQSGTRFQYRLTPSKDAAERLERKEIREWKPPRNKAK